MIIDRKTGNYIFNELSLSTRKSKYEVMVNFYRRENFEPQENRIWINQESVGYFDKRRRIHVRGLTLNEWRSVWTYKLN